MSVEITNKEREMYLEFKKRMTISAARAQIRKLEYNLAERVVDSNSARRACADAASLGLGAVCVLPCHVRCCASLLSKSDVTLVACISYPAGGDTTDVKVKAVKRAFKDGAGEVEVSAPVHFIKDGNFGAFRRELKKLKKASRDRALRIDAECFNLTSDELKKLCAIAADAGITALKTSSDSLGAGKDFNAISSMKQAVKDRCTIKAEGVQTIFEMSSANDMGAEVIGSKNALDIAKQVLAAAEN